MEDHLYTLVPGPASADDDGSWLIVRDGRLYAELRGTEQQPAQRIVWALNATREMATDVEYAARRGGTW